MKKFIVTITVTYLDNKKTTTLQKVIHEDSEKECDNVASQIAKRLVGNRKADVSINIKKSNNVTAKK